ncbi:MULTISPECIES: thiamine phosphate synthase [Anaerotruncus]|uniref:thiamine phosphate synthase n=1 Tax=Anaerotruncus TaxID=244127 RepID=UPI000ABD2704|nr:MULTISPECIES: thiamine phosphate synthase [Anaerotruncus]RGX54528.1 thiamine phosphate synthase [Anaerotruncus sp. AF02-27]
MNISKKDMLLYVVTDRSWLGKNDLAAQVEDTLRAGATFVQLREKQLDDAAFLAEARRIKAVTDRYGVPFVINDNVRVALACGADGVHVGQEDMEAGDVRKLLGPDKILGVSAHTMEEARLAEARGADYLGVGAVFSTSTKLDVNTLPFETLREICGAVSIPVVAIGGISRDNIRKLKGSGIGGVAVISAIFAQPDIYAAARELYNLSKEVTTA